jgi:hypothetical protein
LDCLLNETSNLTDDDESEGKELYRPGGCSVEEKFAKLGEPASTLTSIERCAIDAPVFVKEICAAVTA